MHNIAVPYKITGSHNPYIKMGAAGTPATLAYQSWQNGELISLNTFTWDGTSFSAGEVITLGKVDYEEKEKKIAELQYKWIAEVLQ